MEILLILPGLRQRSRVLALFFLQLLTTTLAFSQGGPPYYTNDPGTPGNFNWEINLGYLPFFFSGQSVSHVPDVDLNFGLGDRIQLTYENAWLRVQKPFSSTKFGLGQSNPGVKWRFYDAGDSLSISIFPQAFLNNPNDAVRRGITAPGDTLELPIEFSKKLGPIYADFEVGYQFVSKDPDAWLTGLVLGHEFTKRLELDAEFYANGTFHPTFAEPTLDVGCRYRLHRPFILLLMAGRGVEPARSDQPYFVGYFGVQILLPRRAFEKEEGTVHPEDTHDK
jgi:hypothetical protein